MECRRVGEGYIVEESGGRHDGVSFIFIFISYSFDLCIITYYLFPDILT